jgi:hypothetical protein
VVAHSRTRIAITLRNWHPRIALAALCCVAPGVSGCEEGLFLSVSAGAPVTVAIRGQVTDCGTPVSGADIVLRVIQDQSGQARPVDESVGPVRTDRGGRYLLEAGPAFAVPGVAQGQLLISAGTLSRATMEFTLRLEMGLPAQDTMRVDTDLGRERGVC